MYKMLAFYSTMLSNFHLLACSQKKTNVLFMSLQNCIPNMYEYTVHTPKDMVPWRNLLYSIYRIISYIVSSMLSSEFISMFHIKLFNSSSKITQKTYILRHCFLMISLVHFHLKHSFP